MFTNIHFRLSLVLGALLLFTAPAALAQRNGDRYRAFAGPNRGVQRFNSQIRFVAPPRAYVGRGFSAGRFYSGRGYFYGGRFWARPYFGIGIGIPFGRGYRTNRGCGYVDNFGRFFPAPCYSY